MNDSAGANFMNKNKDGTGRRASCSDEPDFAKHSVCVCDFIFYMFLVAFVSVRYSFCL